MEPAVASKYYDGRALAFGKTVESCQYHSLQSFAQRQTTVMKFLEGVKGKQILDVGCGPGILTRPLAQDNRIVGLDLSFEMLRLAQSELKPVRGEGAALPFQDNSFDIVLAIEILQHTTNPAIFLKEILRVVRPQGEIVLSSLNVASLFHRLFRPFGKYQGLHFYSPEAICGLLEKERGGSFETQFLGFPFPWVRKANGKKSRRSAWATSWIIRCKKEGEF